MVFLAVAGTIYQNIAIQKLRLVLTGISDESIAVVIAGTSNGVFYALPDDLRTKVIVEITSAMSNVWAWLMASMALSFVLSCFLGVGFQAHYSISESYANTV